MAKKRDIAFGKVPTVSFNRSRFDLSHGVKTAFNVGQLIPLEWREVLPGDTFKEKTTVVTRVTSSFIKPVMDNLFMEVHSFFVPYRLVQDDFERVFGNPNPSAYLDNDLSQIAFNSEPCECIQGTIGDYLGLALGGYDSGSFSVLPFRAFALIYDQWFRNENVTSETLVHRSNTGAISEVMNTSAFSPTNYMGMPPYVTRKKDYFSSCLPKPQKGAPINISIQGDVPVVGNGNVIKMTDDVQGDSGALTLRNFSFGPAADTPSTNYNGFESTLLYGSDLIFPTDYASLVAKTSQLGATTVNDLRFAFQMQKMLERDALYGSRYNEYLLGHFGVHSPDSRLQFTEYLGGGRFPISIQQVAQTSQSTEESPQANVSGYSLSNGYAKYQKGFVEHGIVMTVCFIRQMHTYSQGVSKSWRRRVREDFYDPLFANLGEQPVYTSELYYDEYVGFEDIFGYQEAFAEYRYMPSRISGAMRTTATDSLDIWHFGDKFDSTPYLTEGFINETPMFVDRTLSVESSKQPQFIIDAWFNIDAIRVLPTYSVPGLIDHH